MQSAAVLLRIATGHESRNFVVYIIGSDKLKLLNWYIYEQLKYVGGPIQQLGHIGPEMLPIFLYDALLICSYVLIAPACTNSVVILGHAHTITCNPNVHLNFDFIISHLTMVIVKQHVLKSVGNRL